jgi:hypothetical protein
MMNFSIIEFTESNEIAVAPNNWIKSNGTCHWPPFKHPDRISRCVSERELPTASWHQYKTRTIREFGKSYGKVKLRTPWFFRKYGIFNANIEFYFFTYISATYESARLQLPNAEHTSDLSDFENDLGKRTIVPPRRYENAESEEPIRKRAYISGQAAHGPTHNLLPTPPRFPTLELASQDESIQAIVHHIDPPSNQYAENPLETETHDMTVSLTDINSSSTYSTFEIPTPDVSTHRADPRESQSSPSVASNSSNFNFVDFGSPGASSNSSLFLDTSQSNSKLIKLVYRNRKLKSIFKLYYTILCYTTRKLELVSNVESV